MHANTETTHLCLTQNLPVLDTFHDNGHCTMEDLIKKSHTVATPKYFLETSSL